MKTQKRSVNTENRKTDTFDNPINQNNSRKLTSAHQFEQPLKMADSLEVNVLLGGILVVMGCLKSLLAGVSAVNQLFIHKTRRATTGFLAMSRSIVYKVTSSPLFERPKVLDSSWKSEQLVVKHPCRENSSRRMERNFRLLRENFYRFCYELRLFLNKRRTDFGIPLTAELRAAATDESDDLIIARCKVFLD